LAAFRLILLWTVKFYSIYRYTYTGIVSNVLVGTLIVSNVTELRKRCLGAFLIVHLLGYVLSVLKPIKWPRQKSELNDIIIYQSYKIEFSSKPLARANTWLWVTLTCVTLSTQLLPAWCPQKNWRGSFRIPLHTQHWFLSTSRRI